MTHLTRLRVVIPHSLSPQQAERDRKQSDYTARVNLRAELMTRHINAKLDALMSSSWRRLLESQVSLPVLA